VLVVVVVRRAAQATSDDFGHRDARGGRGFVEIVVLASGERETDLDRLIALVEARAMGRTQRTRRRHSERSEYSALTRKPFVQ